MNKCKKERDRERLKRKFSPKYKLKATWTQSVIDDIEGMHSLDIVSDIQKERDRERLERKFNPKDPQIELVEYLANKIGEEIDAKIVANIKGWADINEKLIKNS